MELWFPYVPITMPSTLCVSLCALPLSPFAALNDALRRFMSLANNLPVTDRVFAWGGERPLIDATTVPPNASIRAAVYGPFCHAIALNPINFCECVKWARYDFILIANFERGRFLPMPRYRADRAVAAARHFVTINLLLPLWIYKDMIRFYFNRHFGCGSFLPGAILLPLSY